MSRDLFEGDYFRGASSSQLSQSEDLVSSTLYSLLNLLSHNTGSTIAPGGVVSQRAVSGAIGEKQDTDSSTLRSASSGKRTDHQRKLMAMTAVQVASRVALEMEREDVSTLCAT
jgi:phosphatidylinositol 4-kinase A